MVNGGMTVSGARTVLSSTLQQSFSTQERDYSKNKQINSPTHFYWMGVAHYDAILANMYIRSYGLSINDTVLPDYYMISNVYRIEGTPIHRNKILSTWKINRCTKFRVMTLTCTLYIKQHNTMVSS